MHDDEQFILLLLFLLLQDYSTIDTVLCISWIFYSLEEDITCTDRECNILHLIAGYCDHIVHLCCTGQETNSAVSRGGERGFFYYFTIPTLPPFLPPSPPSTELPFIVATASNTWGLIILAFLLGYGLVEVPRSLFNASRHNWSLNHCYFRAAKLYIDMAEANETLQELTEVRGKGKEGGRGREKKGFI